MHLLIPPFWLSALSVSAGVLFFFSFRKLPLLTRSSMLWLFQVGVSLIAPALVTFGIIYAYFTWNPEIGSAERQYYVRYLLLYLFFVLNVWNAIILRSGREL